MEDKDLEEFGFEPISEQDLEEFESTSEQDLEEFGFEPIVDRKEDEVEELDIQEESVAAGKGLLTGAAIREAQKRLGDDFGVSKAIGNNKLLQNIRSIAEDFPVLEDFTKAARISGTGRNVVGKKAALESLDKSKELSKEFSEVLDQRRNLSSKKLRKSLEASDRLLGRQNISQQLRNVENLAKKIQESGSTAEESKKALEGYQELLDKYKTEYSKTEKIKGEDIARSRLEKIKTREMGIADSLGEQRNFGPIEVDEKAGIAKMLEVTPEEVIENKIKSNVVKIPKDKGGNLNIDKTMDKVASDINKKILKNRAEGKNITISEPRIEGDHIVYDEIEKTTKEGQKAKVRTVDIPDDVERTKVLGQKFKNLTPTEINTLKSNVGELMDNIPKNTQAFKALTNVKKEIESITPKKLEKIGGEKAEKILKSYRSALNEYQNLNRIKEIEPNLKKGVKGELNLADTFRRTTDDTSGGLSKISSFDEVFKSMKEAGINEETIDRFRKGIQTEADIAELSRKSKNVNLLGFDILRNIAVRSGAATGKLAKPMKTVGRGLLKTLPVVGAGATYAGARAKGMSPTEAGIVTAAEEVTDIIYPIKEALRPNELKSDDPIEDPRKSVEERRRAEIELQKDILANPETSDVNRDFARERLEQLTSEFKALKDEKPVVKATEIPESDQINEVLQTIKTVNNESYNRFIPTLEKAALGNSRERAQKQFELLQQPAFRKMMSDLGFE